MDKESPNQDEILSETKIDASEIKVTEEQESELTFLERLYDSIPGQRFLYNVQYASDLRAFLFDLEDKMKQRLQILCPSRDFEKCTDDEGALEKTE